MFVRLIEALRALGSDPDDRTLADMLWLMDHYTVSGPMTHTNTYRPQHTATHPEDSSQSGSSSATSDGASAPQDDQPLYPPGGHGDIPNSRGRVLKIPGAPPLPHALDIARALRPLRQRLPVPDSPILDEQPTVHATAEAGGILSPVFRSTSTRWLSVDLVIDQTRSMAVWHQTILEFRRLLVRQGAFRHVRTWSLVTSESTAALYIGLDADQTTGSQRRPDELRDVSGRRLILFFSDCVAPAWHHGDVQRLCRRWGETNPLAIVQMLPSHLWNRSALGVDQAVQMTSRQMGGGNAQLRTSVHATDDEFDEAKKRSIPVPVITLDASTLYQWANVLTGKQEAWTTGVLFEYDEIYVPATPNLTGFTPEQRVRRFLQTATGVAQELASLSSYVPITLPIIRLVQAALLPGSGLSHIAELFLSGLLRVVSVHDDPEETLYEFHDGVREVLQRSVSQVRAEHIIGLLDHEERVIHVISQYLADQTGSTRDVIAIASDISALAQDVHIPPQAFGTIKRRWLGIDERTPHRSHPTVPGVMLRSSDETLPNSSEVSEAGEMMTTVDPGPQDSATKVPLVEVSRVRPQTLSDAEGGKRRGPRTLSTESAYEADLKSFIKHINKRLKDLKEFLETDDEITNESSETGQTSNLIPPLAELKIRYNFFREIRREFQRYREVDEDRYAKIIARSEEMIKSVETIYGTVKKICKEYEKIMRDKESYSIDEMDELVTGLYHHIMNLHTTCQKKSLEIQVRLETKRGNRSATSDR